jgi:hypothetical protein
LARSLSPVLRRSYRLADLARSLSPCITGNTADSALDLTREIPRRAGNFDMQDEIVARLANQLGTELVAAEARRAEQVPNPNSMDLYFQGMLHANSGATPEYMARARSFFERALTLDPAMSKP